MTRKVVLHVGAPKCGSTYLQTVMLQNRAALLAAGIAYPHSGGPHLGNAGHIPSITADDFDKLVCSPVTVLSHEDLLPIANQAEAFFALAKARSIEIEVLIFLRPLKEILFADYSQFLKQNFTRWLISRNPFDGQDFHAFIRKRRKVLLLAKFVTKWQALLPDKQVFLRSHKHIRDTVEDRIPPVALDWSVSPERTNPSLRMIDCDRISDALRDPLKGDYEITEMLKEAYKNVSRPDPGKTPERLAIIEKAVRAESDRFYDRFSIRL